MKPTFLIYISSPVRAYEFPRIDGFKHTDEFKDVLDSNDKPLGERYVYLGRELTIQEFNDAAAKIFNPAFNGEERSFQPLALDPEIIAENKAKREAAAEAARLAAEEAQAAEDARIEAEKQEAEDREKQEAADREAARQSKLAVEAHLKKLEAEAAAKAKAEAAGTPPAPIAGPGEATNVVSMTPNPPADTPPTEGGESPAAAPFTMVESSIMQGDVRIGSLRATGLRLIPKFKSLEPEVTAWLATQQP